MNRCFPRLTRGLAAGMLACAGALAAPVEPPPPAGAPPPARWLLVVNTSAAMERRARAVEGVVGELLASGMRGELNPRDEIGLWVFNRELIDGAAPLQTWTPAQSNVIAGRTVNVLARQRFQGAARLAPALDSLAPLIAESYRLTILIVTDATGAFTGTPWDAELNAAVAAEKAVLERTRMPLIITLRSYKGELIGQRVTLAPWPVEFPPFPAAPVAAKAEPPPEPPRPAEPPREIRVIAKPPPPPLPAVAALGPAPAVSAKPAPEVAGEAASPAKAGPAETVMNIVRAPAVVTVTTPLPAPAPEIPAPAVEVGLKTEPGAGEPLALNSTSAPGVGGVSGPAPAFAVVVPSKTSPTGLSASVDAANAASITASAASAIAPSSSPVAVPDAVAAPAATAALEPAGRAHWLLAGGAGFLSIASVLAVVLAMRARRAAPASLITRSAAGR